MPHRIRLARPWALTDGSDCRISVERRFHRPTGLAADQPVDLVVRCKAGVRLIAIEINGCRLPIEEMGSDLDWRHSVAPRLDPSNLIGLDFSRVIAENPPKPADETVASMLPSLSQSPLNPDRFDLSPWAEVWLEIGGS